MGVQTMTGSRVNTLGRARVWGAQRQRSARLRMAVCRPRASADSKDEAKAGMVTPPTAETGAGLKAVWYGAETFGNLVGMQKKMTGEAGEKGQAAAAAGSGLAQLTREQAVAMLKDDYDCNYFVSGLGSMEAYAPDCTFADPFVSFDGVDRFKNNVSNLGGLMEDIKLNIKDWEEGEDTLQTNWNFSCVLQLPWRPKLAAAGGTTHVFDKTTGKVVKHIERWDIEPAVVVKQLLKPSAAFPTSKVEVVMMSLAEGDVKGVWFELSPLAFKAALPLTALTLFAQGVAGDNLPGVLESVGSVAEFFLVLSALTEVIKLVGQLGF